MHFSIRFMLNMLKNYDISLRFENFITLKAFEEGKWHVKLFYFPQLILTLISRFLFVIRVLNQEKEMKIKWKKGSKDSRRSSVFFKFFIWFHSAMSEKGAKRCQKEILSSDIFKIYLKIFPQHCVLCVLRASCQYEKTSFHPLSQCISFHSSFSFWFIFLA